MKLQGGWGEVGVDLFSQITNNRTRSGFKFHQGRFSLAIRKTFFFERLVRHWNRLLKEATDSSSLEVLKNHREVVLRDTA